MIKSTHIYVPEEREAIMKMRSQSFMSQMLLLIGLLPICLPTFSVAFHMVYSATHLLFLEAGKHFSGGKFW